MTTDQRTTGQRTTGTVATCPACGARNRVPVASSGRPRCAKCHADLPWLVDAGDGDFDAAVTTKRLVLVDLWAPWCGPCRMVAPVLERLAQDLAGDVKVVKVNVDTSPQVAQRFDARSIPMLLFMRDGTLVDTVVGAQPDHVLRARVGQLLGRSGV
jgi:thioredoxin 2